MSTKRPDSAPRIFSVRAVKSSRADRGLCADKTDIAEAYTPAIGKNPFLCIGGYLFFLRTSYTIIPPKIRAIRKPAALFAYVGVNMKQKS